MQQEVNKVESFFITGSTDGIGLETAKQLAHGAKSDKKRIIVIHG